MAVYYNEIDPFASEWLRNLIKIGAIAYGEVDERSIEEVEPADLKGFTQCHFFAGIGGWSLALRLAGVPDEYPIWTGSCPCQSFSLAGKKNGKNDERHLLPVFAKLINECKPVGVFGEQVSSAIGFGWFDDLQAYLRDGGYTTGGAVLTASCVGAPQIRERLFWGAWLDYAPCKRYRGYHNGKEKGEFQAYSHDGQSVVWDCGGRFGTYSQLRGESPANFWANAEWRRGNDGYIRPIEPLSNPLAYGLPARLGRVRGYGNAIVPQVGAVFVEEFLDSVAELKESGTFAP